ncbi:MAG: cation-translocating P-type ATPase [Elusimicrobia bacterium]|nr:cation-translocating P-type ATPase [Elusimicrobiota bacterium]
MDTAWHALTAEDALSRLRCDPTRGLDEREAAERLARGGRNELLDRGRRSSWDILRAQTASTMFALLAAAAALSALLRDFTDAAAISAILLINAALGFTQEHRADRAIAALKKLAVSRCRALRSGRLVELDPAELVEGDVIPLEAGARVPADARLIQAAALRCEEASLTGESEPTDKDAAAVGERDAPLGDRKSMVFLGTTIVAGRALAVVAATGMRTEMGRIAESLGRTPEGLTPLQRKLEEVARGLALAAAAIVLVFFGAGLLRGEPFQLMFLTAVSMAVAAVPEGLPAVIVATLAIAARRMLARKALVRKLTAVEGLGSVTVICSDKTGTLTENRMTAATLDLGGLRTALDGSAELPGPQAALALAAAALCNDAYLLPVENGQTRAVGDPTEAALVAAAARLGLSKPALDRAFPRLGEQPFDSGRKRMSTAHSIDVRELDAPPELRRALDAAGLAGGVVFVKGSVDGLLRVCAHYWDREAPRPATEAWRARARAAESGAAAAGLRVIGVAYRPLGGAEDGAAREYERDLTFLGFFGLLDPPRPDVKDAVAACRAAGIKLIMITGDHPLTARSAARTLGIPEGDRILTGRELMAMTEPELERIVEGVSLYARVSPEHKLKIVAALQARGHVVAMTGDGVNDAPALKKADIGVAMGITGTDVAKEAAAMVLLDDRFPTIVAAIKEGRVVYDNVRKFLKFLMTTNVAELAIMLLAPALGMPLPLTPIQILWVNLLTDGLPALALGFEAAEPGVMKRPPRPPTEALFDRRMVAHIVWVGALMAGLVLVAGKGSWESGREHWRSEVLTIVVLTQMAHVLAIRSEGFSLRPGGRPGNGLLPAAVALTLGLQAAILYVPALRPVFATAPLSTPELLRALACAAAVFAAVELEKAFLRRKTRANAA